MKKTKSLFIIALLAVMALVSVMPYTFSWYNHDNLIEGDEAQYTRSSLPVSGGTVTMATNKLRMQSDGINLYLDDKGDVVDDEGIGSATSTIAANHNQYYRTKLTNNSNADAMVSLYALGITNSTNVYVGSVVPTINERCYSARASRDYGLNAKNRVYFQTGEVSNWGSSIFVMNNNQEVTAMSVTTDDDQNDFYYADLPLGTTSFYFFSSADDGKHRNWFKTHAIKNHVAGRVYILTNTTTDDNQGFAEYKTTSVDRLINVSRFYDTVHILRGQTTSIALKSGEFSANRVEYSIDKNDYLAISATTGLISYKAGATEIPNNTTITAHITLYGVYNDTMVIDVSISSPRKLDAVSVCNNIKVPAHKTAEVQWYVKNKGSSSAEFDGLYLTK